MLSYKCCPMLLALFYRKSILKFCGSGTAASIIDLIRTPVLQNHCHSWYLQIQVKDGGIFGLSQ